MYKNIFIFIALLSICLGIYSVINRWQNEKHPDSSYASFESFWKEYIIEHTPQIAYQKFKDSYSGASPTEQHLVAHLFGGALYSAVGISGLAICDMHYASGCFHEFLGRALREHGDSILYDVDTYCKESTYDCQHGIGHGILAYSGYEHLGLLKALRLCRSIGSTDVRDGCFGGIFMEYNIFTMLGPETPIRIQDQGEVPDALCQSVPEFASQACYFWLPQWFLASEKNISLHEKFFKVTKECQTIHDGPSRLTCYSGITNELLSYTDNFNLMAQYCDDNDLSVSDPLFRVQCRSGVASSLFMDIKTRDRAAELCEKLSGRQYDFCKFFSTVGGGKRIIPYSEWN